MFLRLHFYYANTPQLKVFRNNISAKISIMTASKKLSATEQRFQAWLAEFRSGKRHGPLLARKDMTDEQLRDLWKNTLTERLARERARKERAAKKRS